MTKLIFLRLLTALMLALVLGATEQEKYRLRMDSNNDLWIHWKNDPKIEDETQGQGKVWRIRLPGWKGRCPQAELDSLDKLQAVFAHIGYELESSGTPVLVLSATGDVTGLAWNATQGDHFTKLTLAKDPLAKDSKFGDGLHKEDPTVAKETTPPPPPVAPCTDNCVTCVFTLSYADPARVAVALNGLKGLIGEGGVAQIYDNQILDTEKPSNPAPAREKGWGAGGGASSVTTRGVLNMKGKEDFASDLTNAPENKLLVYALEENIDDIRNVICQLDVAPRMVDLEVKVCQVTENGLKDLGVRLLRPGRSTTDDMSPASAVAKLTELSSATGKFDVFNLGNFKRAGYELDSIVSLMVQDGTAEVFAEPTLSTMEGYSAGFFVGDEIPYIAGAPGALTNAALNYLSVGVQLHFLAKYEPRDRTITLDVRPAVTTLVDISTLGNGFTAPRVTNRELRSVIRLHDGETFAMAGLVSDEEISKVQKLPILGDLPVVGKLFRNKNRRHERTEIVIFVTPHLRDCDICNATLAPDWEIANSLRYSLDQ